MPREFAGLDREQVREWYNGYRWRSEETVYNPYDVLLLFQTGYLTITGEEGLGGMPLYRLAIRTGRCARA